MGAMTTIFDWQCDADLMDIEVPEGATEFHSEDVDGLHGMFADAARHVNAAFAAKRRELGLGPFASG